MTGLEPPTGYDLLLQSRPAPLTAGPAGDTRLPPWTVLSGPLARSMGKLLRGLVGEDPYDQRFPDGRYYTSCEYRLWVRRRLREDNFFARIGAGIDMFPDIRNSLPAIQQWLENQNRPVKLPAMIRHMCRNLEWYLQPDSRPVYSRELPKQFFRLVASSVVCLISFYLTYSFGDQTDLSRLLVTLSGLTALGAMLMAVYFSLRTLAELANYGTACGEKPGSMKYTINAAELYLYLIELYEERPLVPLSAGEVAGAYLAGAVQTSEGPDTANRQTSSATELVDGVAASELHEVRQRLRASD